MDHHTEGSVDFIQERSSVVVAARVRPSNDREKSCPDGQYTCISVTDKVVTVNDSQSKSQHYAFDKCFGEAASQSDVYMYIAPLMLPNLWVGYNTCLFAYGQTGSGKTHTMMGHSEEEGQQGVLPRLCADMFRDIQKRQESNSGVSFRVEASYMEIYCEKIKDLLKPESKDLKVRQGREGVFVGNLSWHVVTDWRSCQDLLRQGTLQRATAETKLNDRSSRSHAIFALNVTIVTLDNRVGSVVETTTRFSKMNIVDLAGSERVKESGAVGERFEEARNINLSLTTLGRVIDVLVEISAQVTAKKKSAAVAPYRESVLTYLLSDSLGGNSKTIMIATVSPSSVNIDESRGTLRYASTARNIVNIATVNELGDNTKMIEKLQSQNHSLKQQLEAERKKIDRYEAMERDFERLKTEHGTHLRESSQSINMRKELYEERNKVKALENKFGRQVEERDRRIQELQGLLTVKHTETDTLLRRQGTAEVEKSEKYQALQTQLRNLESEKRDFNETVRDLRLEGDHLKREIERCERQRQSADADYVQKERKWRKSLSEVEQQLNSIIQERDEAQQEVTTMRSNYGRLSSQHTAVRSREATLRAEVQRSAVEGNEIRCQLQSMTQQLEESQACLQKQASRIRMLEEVEKEGSKASEATKAYEEKVLTETRKVNALQQQVEDLQVCLQAAENKVLASEAKIERIHRLEVEKLKQAMAAETHLTSTLTHEVQTIRQEMEQKVNEHRVLLIEVVEKHEKEACHQETVIASLRSCSESLSEELKRSTTAQEALKHDLHSLSEKYTELKKDHEAQVAEGYSETIDIELQRQKNATQSLLSEVHDTRIALDRALAVTEEERSAFAMFQIKNIMDHETTVRQVLVDGFVEGMNAYCAMSSSRRQGQLDTTTKELIGKERDLDRGLREKERRLEESVRELSYEIHNAREALGNAERRAARATEQEAVTQRMYQSTVEHHKQEEIKLRAEAERSRSKYEDLQKKHQRETLENSQSRARMQSESEKFTQRVGAMMEEHTKSKQNLQQENEKLRKNAATWEVDRVEFQKTVRELTSRNTDLLHDLTEARNEVRTVNARLEQQVTTAQQNQVLTEDLHIRCGKLLRDNRRLTSELRTLRPDGIHSQGTNNSSTLLDPGSPELIHMDRNDVLAITQGFDIITTPSEAAAEHEALARAAVLKAETVDSVKQFRLTTEQALHQHKVLMDHTHEVVAATARTAQVMGRSNLSF